MTMQKATPELIRGDSTVLFDDGGGDLGVAGLIQTKDFSGGFAQIQNASFGIRATVIDAHDNGGARLFTDNFQLSPERERPVGTSKSLAVKYFTACGLFPIKTLAVITSIARKRVTDRRFLLDS